MSTHRHQKILFIVPLLMTILFLILLFSCSFAQPPIIEQGKILFHEGKIRRYEPYQLIHSDAEEALRKHEPVSISEKPVLVSEWERLVLIKTMNLYEGDKKEIRVFNYKGDLLNPKLSFIGEAVFIEKTKRIFLLQKSSHYIVNKSILLDADGKKLIEIEQSPNVFNMQYSEDGKVICLLSSHLYEGRPFIRIRAFDYNGNIIKMEETYEEKEIIINYKGIDYEFIVQEPSVPG